MASSKKSLTEQVLRRLASGDTTSAGRAHPKEIEKAIEQVLNAKLRVQVLEGFQFDDTIPPACMIASYDNVPVTSWNGISKCTLPAIPLALPKNMGVWRIGPALGGVSAPAPGSGSTTPDTILTPYEYIIGTTSGAPVAGETTFTLSAMAGKQIDLYINRIPQSTLDFNGDMYYEKPLASNTIILHDGTWQDGDLIQIKIYG